MRVTADNRIEWEMKTFETMTADLLQPWQNSGTKILW
jgi:hypothetical protein